MASLLEGIRIVDMTSVIFGPYCTATLASLGADVIKLEPEQGDEVRRVGQPVSTRGMGPCHMVVNRGKRSVVWNLKAASGRAKFEKLLRTADVFIHNLRAGAVERSRLDYETIKAVRSDLIYVHCTGFGSDGPYAGRSAYDDIIQAASGTTSLLSRADGRPEPRFLPMALADKVSGLHGVYAVMGALLHRQRTGQGQFVEVPMFECYTHFLLQEHLYGRTFVPPNADAGYPRQLDPNRQPMRTADGWIVIAPYTDERWVRFFAVVGLPGFLGESGLDNARARLAGLDVMHAKAAEVLALRATDVWLALFDRHDIPASRAADLNEAIADPHLNQTGFFQRRTHPTEGDYLAMRQPVRFSAHPDVPVRDPPRLGEHSEDAL